MFTEELLLLICKGRIWIFNVNVAIWCPVKGNRLIITSNQDATKRNIKHDGNKNAFIIDIMLLTENSLVGLFWVFTFFLSSSFISFMYIIGSSISICSSTSSSSDRRKSEIILIVPSVNLVFRVSEVIRNTAKMAIKKWLGTKITCD